MELRSAKLKDWKGIASIYNEAFPSTRDQGLLPLENWQSLLLDQRFDYVVAVQGNQVLGVASLIVIEKPLRGGSKMGLIEDVAVSKSARNQGIGQSLIQKLQQLARSKDCYKTILNCPEDVVPFYERCGFHRKEIQMRWNP